MSAPAGVADPELRTLVGRAADTAHVESEE
jgi:hypothetical protein